jgi:LacI family transcriptional regulator
MKDLPTIKDVALRAGVGIATVSRVLNNHPSLSNETRDKVLQAVRELGYTPNQVARSMVTKSSLTLGLVIPDIRNSFFPAVARGFEDEAHRSGYGVILADTDEDLHRERVYLDMLLQNRVAGVAFTGTSTPEPLVAGLQASGMPVVSVNSAHQRAGVDTVWTDHRQAAYAAVQYLLEMGHRRIAHLAAPLVTQVGAARRDGYFAALADWHVEIANDMMLEGDFFKDSGYERTQKLLKQHPDVTAIFAATDLIAVGVLKAVRHLGLECPRDISVMGFNNLEEAVIVDPELTTISTNSYHLGRVLAQQLVRRIGHREDPPVAIQVPFRLIVRQSTAPPRN